VSSITKKHFLYLKESVSYVRDGIRNHRPFDKAEPEQDKLRRLTTNRTVRDHWKSTCLSSWGAEGDEGSYQQ